MDINLNINSPTATKFIETVASGIGAVAAPALTWVQAKADASSIKLIAEAQREAKKMLQSDDDTSAMISSDLEIIRGRAESRFRFQEEKRQRNIENVVRSAATQLPEQTTDQEVNPDWTARFFENVKDVSNEEVQKIWGKILAGEVGAPGRTSLKTLDVLKNLTQKDAEIFNRLVSSFLIGGDFIYYPYSFDEPMANRITSFDDFLDLGDSGLVHTETNLAKIWDVKSPGHANFTYCGFLLMFDLEKEKPAKEIKIPEISFTRAGKEIANFVGNPSPDVKYIYSLARFLRSEGAILFAPNYDEKSEKYVGRYEIDPAIPERQIEFVQKQVMEDDGKTPTGAIAWALITADNAILQAVRC